MLYTEMRTDEVIVWFNESANIGVFRCMKQMTVQMLTEDKGNDFVSFLFHWQPSINRKNTPIAIPPGLMHSILIQGTGKWIHVSVHGSPVIVLLCISIVSSIVLLYYLLFSTHPYCCNSSRFEAFHSDPRYRTGDICAWQSTYCSIVHFYRFLYCSIVLYTVLHSPILLQFLQVWSVPLWSEVQDRGYLCMTVHQLFYCAFLLFPLLFYCTIYCSPLTHFVAIPPGLKHSTLIRGTGQGISVHDSPPIVLLCISIVFSIVLLYSILFSTHPFCCSSSRFDAFHSDPRYRKGNICVGESICRMIIIISSSRKCLYAFRLQLKWASRASRSWKKGIFNTVHPGLMYLHPEMGCFQTTVKMRLKRFTQLEQKIFSIQYIPLWWVFIHKVMVYL